MLPHKQSYFGSVNTKINMRKYSSENILASRWSQLLAARCPPREARAVDYTIDEVGLGIC